MESASSDRSWSALQKARKSKARFTIVIKTNGREIATHPKTKHDFDVNLKNYRSARSKDVEIVRVQERYPL